MAKNTAKWTEFSGEFVQDTAVGNGSAAIITTSLSIGSQEGVWVSLNGLMLARGTHYNVTLPSTVTFTTAPAIGQSIIIKYIKG